MKISYLDGFTQELIKFTAQEKGSSWKIDARWFSPNSEDNAVTFKIPRNKSESERLKQNLLTLNENYEVMVTDLASYDVSFTIEGQKYFRSFYGLGEDLYEEYPEIEAQLEHLAELCNEIRAEIVRYSNKD